MSDESFCILDLPHEIEPDNMTTTFKNGKVEITVPTVNMDKKITVGAKAA
jgi:HSP20 family molecular chaperone IbpA